MNLLLLHPQDFTADNIVVLSDYRAKHIHKYLKPRIGDNLRVGVINSAIGTATLRQLTKSSCELHINHLDQSPPPPLPVTLILALPRPLMLKRILQHATSMGVKHIVLLNTANVEVSYWRSSDLEEKVLQTQLLLGLEQAIDTRLPLLEIASDFQCFITNRLPDIQKGHCVVLAPDAQSPLLEARPQPSHTTIIIGPERGLREREITTFIEAGFECRQLGNRTLRVETAVTAALARLMR